ncbi:MAG: hypothetical protein V3V56_11500 [bacterium]
MIDRILRLAGAALRLAGAALLAAALLAPAPAIAGPWRPYDPAAFAQAQTVGKTIFVSIYAGW